MKNPDKLFESLDIGRITLKNRIVMSPMTRSRADAAGVLPDYSADYYSQRATAGLIVAEGTQPSPEGQGYARTPGIYTPAQIEAWQKVTKAVHAKGGLIFLQLMHTGRVGSALNRTVITPLVSASNLQAAGKVFTDQSGLVDMDKPEALTKEGIAEVMSQFSAAARHAMSAGFDGVELHGASGYLPHQFFSAHTNQRSDEYGASLENRMRFMVELVDHLVKATGDAKKVGVRLSPGVKFNDIGEINPKPDYEVLLKALDARHLAYVNVHLEPTLMVNEPSNDGTFAEVKWLRSCYKGVLIASGGFTKDSGEVALVEGYLDAVGIGAPFIANPDLVYRFKYNIPLATPDASTFYTPGPKGYVDYPEVQDPMKPFGNDRFPDWQRLYQKKDVDTMPWFHADLDSDLKDELAKRAITTGTFLDIGTGPGTQAEQLYKLGFSVTATDLSVAAIDKAMARFKDLPIDFKQDDILDSKLQGPFDYAFDRGCFHVFAPENQSTYVETVARCIKRNGILFLKTFSTKQTGVELGPYRFSPEDIRLTFGAHFELVSSVETVYQGTLNPLPKAIFCVLKRK